uniref:Uncharacterized protein n=1 Tax=Glossina pallidipes TaxID=7398 RepID=A0A1A9ZFL8_GLOPL
MQIKSCYNAVATLHQFSVVLKIGCRILSMKALSTETHSAFWNSIYKDCIRGMQWRYEHYFRKIIHEPSYNPSICNAFWISSSSLLLLHEDSRVVYSFHQKQLLHRIRAKYDA